MLVTALIGLLKAHMATENGKNMKIWLSVVIQCSRGAYCLNGTLLSNVTRTAGVVLKENIFPLPQRGDNEYKSALNAPINTTPFHLKSWICQQVRIQNGNHPQR
jgi:hypothetical protein